MPEIYEFISSFTNDISRTNRFNVQLNIPFTIATLAGIGDRTMTLRCESAEFPGKTLNTHDQRIYGPIERYPNQVQFQDVTLTFIVGSDMKEKSLFDIWFEKISPTRNWDMEYKIDESGRKTYTADIVINQYDVSDQLVYAVRLVDAFPHSMNQLDLNWSDDNHHRLTITFAYFYWEVLTDTTPFKVLTTQSDLSNQISNPIKGGNPNQELQSSLLQNGGPQTRVQLPNVPYGVTSIARF